MTQKIWGGRFTDSPDDIMEEINASIGFDKRLALYDIAGSRAHCQMLAAQGIISDSDATAILDGLAQIEADIKQGQLPLQRSLEDIHMNIEARLEELIGTAAGRLHIARSRNDQVATDFRLYLRDMIDHICTQIHHLQTVLAKQAEKYADSLMPGFTHMQIAQPVTYGHYLLAYVEMLARDSARFCDARKRLNECPLGAAALAGTSFPIDRQQTAKALGFDKPMANSIDSVADRDFALEALSCAAMTAVHLSRLGEEIVIFASSPFGFFRLPDNFSTGSSIMPQKRNPDAAELIRAKAGRIIGALTGLLVVMKGLPLAYAKDMQEDKEGCFDAFDNLSLCLAAMSGMMAALTPDCEKMHQAAADNFSTATDLADWLVRAHDMTFRDAHHLSGRLVGEAEKQGCALHNLSIEDLQKFDARLTAAIYDVLDPQQALASRMSEGGTAPELVKQAAQDWLAKLADK